MRNIESSSLVAVGFSTTLTQVAGFHRADPSTTLDKANINFDIILSYFTFLSTPARLFFLKNLFIISLWTFLEKNGIMTVLLIGDETLEKLTQTL